MSLSAATPLGPEIHRAIDTKPGRPVALKLLPESLREIPRVWL